MEMKNGKGSQGNEKHSTATAECNSLDSCVAQVGDKRSAISASDVESLIEEIGEEDEEKKGRGIPR